MEIAVQSEILGSKVLFMQTTTTPE